jgi:anthranilate phosphoribosyltransferase
VTEQLAPAMQRAAESIDSGAAQAALDRWIEVSRG